MSKIPWILFYVAVIMPSEAEHERKNHICTYNTTTAVDQVVNVTKETRTESNNCSINPIVKLICKTITVFKKIIEKKIKVPKKQTVVRCCEGYVNETGVCKPAPCKLGFYGKNCTKRCSCKEKQYEMCTMTGQCMCKDGWIGENCSQACKTSKYGRNCEFDCSCRNNAKCDHISGSCNCSTIRGWTGDRCEIKCLPAFYGPDCSLRCNCSNDRVCDHQTGYCSCKAGKTGHDCSQECEYGKFGKDCTQNCTCNETELCKKEDGSCQLVDVCVSDYTKNCIKNMSVVKCNSLKKLCNDTEQINTKKGLEKTATDLCCKDTNNDYSLCLSYGNCSCDEISTDRNCKPPQRKNRDKKSISGLDQDDDLAVVPVAIATTLAVVITLGVLIIVIYMIRQRRQTKSKMESTVTFTSLENTPSQSEPRQINTDGDGDQDVNLNDTNINDQVDQYENDVIQAVAPSNHVDGTNYEELQQNCTGHTYLNVQDCHIYDPLVLTEENK